MNCPECGLEIVSLPCEGCIEIGAEHERRMQEIVEEFGAVRGAPITEEAKESFEFALTKVREWFDRRGADLEAGPYDEADLLQSESWWFISRRSMGCSGYIVDLRTGYVNSLGSGLSLRNYIWGHEQGIVCDLVDFTFAKDTDPALVRKLVRRFMFVNPGPSRAPMEDWEFYQESEIRAAVERQFPAFKRHCVSPGIPEIREAYEKEGLRFTCTLSAEPDGAS